MRPKAKYAVIYRHRMEYSISFMCKFFGVSRSGYYDFVHRLGKPEKDTDLAEEIRQQQERSHNTYGYRRMQLALAAKGIYHNPKTVLRVMKKYNLLSEIRRRKRWVNMGQQLHRYENLLNRQFQSDRPNHKWVTDIAYITIWGSSFLQVLLLVGVSLKDLEKVSKINDLQAASKVFLFVRPYNQTDRPVCQQIIWQPLQDFQTEL